MQIRRTLAVAAVVAIAGGVALAAQAPPPPQSLNGVSFRINEETRALTPLEFAKSKKRSEYRGPEYCYIEGASSPVVFRQSESLVFVSRYEAEPKELDRYSPLVAPEMKLFKLERLFVSDEKRRYATGQFVPMNGMVYGDRFPDVNPKKPKEVGQYYASRPAQLPPGEYAITVGGMFIVGRCGGPVSAFRVVAGS